MMNLAKILSDHKEWLDSKGRSGKCADLQNADLEDANLSGAVLVGAVLQGTNLVLEVL